MTVSLVKSEFVNNYDAQGKVILTALKEITGRNLKAEEFTFKLTDMEGNVIGMKKNAAGGAIVFDEINYNQKDMVSKDAAGNDVILTKTTRQYQIFEVKETLGGVKYDEHIETITVTLTDNQDGTITATADKTGAAVKYTNEYTSKGSVVLTAMKVLTGRNLTADEFTFKLTDMEGNVIDTKKNAAGGAVVFDAIDYTEADMAGKDAEGKDVILTTTTRQYQIFEVKETLGGVKYDEHIETITVTLTDNQDGTITATADKTGAAVKYTNEYTSKGSVVLTAMKVLTGRNLKANEFTFKLTDMEGNVIDTKKNAAGGAVVFDAIDYTEADMAGKNEEGKDVILTTTTRQYQIFEVKETLGGMKYDEHIETITVTLTDNQDGTITAKPDKSGAAVKFINDYTSKGSVVLTALKKLNGRNLKAGEFTFKLTDMEGKEIDTQKNAADGTVTFKAIDYTEADMAGKDEEGKDVILTKTTRQYQIFEVKETLEGVTYDEHIETITVTLTDNQDGTITATPDKSGAYVVFINDYTSKGSVELSALKELTGRELLADEFTFKLTDMEGNEIDTKKNAADGTVTFKAIDFTEADMADKDVILTTTTKQYQIFEVKETLGGVKYDEHIETITVTLTDDQKGTINATADKTGAAVKFTNEYTSEGGIDFTAKKTLVRRELKAGEFSFVLSQAKVDAEGNVIEETPIETVENDAEGKISFSTIPYSEATMVDEDGNILKTRTLYYTIKEVKPDDADKTVIYDSKVVLIRVDLADEQNGKITATASDNAKEINFTNIVVKTSKVDITDQHELEGATIQVIDVETNEVIFEFVSGVEATEIENLEINKVYRLVETVAPVGYNLQETSTTFSVDETGTYHGDTNTNEEGVLLVEDDISRVQATVKKVWDDDNNRDGKRPASIQVDLEANGKVIKTVTLYDSSNWMHTEKGLPKVDAEQKDIVYTWREHEVGNGYTVTNPGATSGTVTTITNSYGPEKIDIPVQKVWEDNNNEKQLRPAQIAVQLFADGEAIGEPVVLNEANGWKYTWTGMNKNANPTGASGSAKPIKYSVAETEVPAGYTPTVDGFVITNTLETGKLQIEKTFEFTPVEPEEPDNTPVEIPVIKSWDDNGNQDGNRPESVTVRLLANGTEVASTSLNEENGWKFTFTDLPRLDEAGEKISYTITEDAVKDYRAEINGYNILNVYEPETTSATVTKTWNHNGNPENLRPTSIYMKLSNGKVVLLNEENNWTATVNDLPVRVNGTEVNYTWTEQTVVGYVLDSMTQEGTVTTFANRYVPMANGEEDKPQPKKGGDTWTVFEEYETALGGETIINHVGDCFD